MISRLAGLGAAAAAAAAGADAAVAVAAAYAAAAADAEAAVAVAAVAVAAAEAAAEAAETYADYQLLLRMSGGRSGDREFVVPTEFFERPLWLQGLPKGWERILDGFQKDLFQHGLERVWKLYEGFLQGSRVDWDFLERWIVSVVDEIQQRETEAEAKPKAAEAPAKEDEKPPRKRAKRKSPAKKKPKTPDPEEADEPLPPAPEVPDGLVPTAGDDKPAEHDLLGRQALVETLGTMFVAPGQATPFTLALLGNWGSGKSTVMSCLKQWFKGRADREKKAKQAGTGKPGIEVLTADFNAWEYDQVDNIRAGLAHEVVRGLLKDVGCFKRLLLARGFALREHRSGLWHLVLGLWGIAVLVAVAQLSFLFSDGLLSSTFFKGLAGGGVVAGAVAFLVANGKELRTLLQHPLSTEMRTYLRLPAYRKDLGEIPVIKQHLGTLCELRLGKPKEGEPDKRRLIVFVDDLDRCKPERITDVFDAIRLIMDIPGVIVMVMIDPRIAMRAVAEKYQKFAEDGRDKFAVARDYLGKIIQLPVSLRRVKGGDLERFIRLRLFPNVKAEETGEVDKEPPVPVEPEPGGSTQRPEPEDVGGDPEKPDRGSEPSPAEPPLAPKPEVPQPPSPRADVPAEKSVEQRSEEIEREMEDRQEDVDGFVELADVHGMSNPRQLLRLRNCYRFLKGLNGRLDFGLPPRLLMALLFWQEYLNELPAKHRTACREGLLQPLPEKTEVPDGVREQLEKIREHYAGWFKEEPPGLESARKLVRLVTLPYHDGVEAKAKPDAGRPKADAEGGQEPRKEKDQK